MSKELNLLDDVFNKKNAVIFRKTNYIANGLLKYFFLTKTNTMWHFPVIVLCLPASEK